MRLRGDLFALFNHWKEAEWGEGWFLLPGKSKTRGKGLKLWQCRSMLEIMKNFSTERMVKHRNGLPREMVELSPPKCSKMSRHFTWGCGLGDVVVFSQNIGLDDLEGLFFHENKAAPKPPAPWQAVTPCVAVWAASTRRWMSFYLYYLLTKLFLCPASGNTP